MNATLYQYPKCSTCRKAATLLRSLGVVFESIDLVETPPSVATLRVLHERSGLDIRKLFNVSGQSYRAGGFKDRLPNMDLEEALEALAADGKLIKRPILVTDEQVLVGFDEDAYRTLFEA